MIDMTQKDYVAVVQCDIVMERCSGYGCERSFFQRTGGFAAYPKDRPYRIVYMTCGGCCGRAVGRKLTNLVRRLRKDGVSKDRIVVQLSSCMTKDNFHAPPCPHLEYIRTLIGRVGLDVCSDTLVHPLSEKRRGEGRYGCGG